MIKPKKYLAFLAVIPVLFYFWPISLGGNTDYISVYGESMLPTMENGALAVLKQDVHYGISDIVAYHFSEEGVKKIIIHRIIATTPDGSFVLKGDHNKSNDPEKVKPDQIIGKLFFQVPYVGYMPSLFKNPLVLIVTMMAIAFYSMLDKKKKGTEVKEVVVPKNSVKKKEKTGKRRQISLFIPALVVNLAYYVLCQYSISVERLPRDGYTTFLLGFFDPYLAGTIVFSSWFVAILGSYIISRYSISIEYKRSTNVPSGSVQMTYQRLVPFKSIAQLFWMIFIGLEGLYMFVLISSLR